MTAAIMEKNMEVPQKIQNRTTYDPPNPLLGVDATKMVPGCQRDSCTVFCIIIHYC
jgi:hypothetical protein